MENLDVLYEILLLICQWWNIEHPGLFLMKIHPVERKLYQIINGGTTALVYDESYLTLRGMHSWLNPLCNYSLSAINRLIACLHFRVQRDYKMPRNLGVTGNDGGLRWPLYLHGDFRYYGSTYTFHQSWEYTAVCKTVEHVKIYVIPEITYCYNSW